MIDILAREKLEDGREPATTVSSAVANGRIAVISLLSRRSVSSFCHVAQLATQYPRIQFAWMLRAPPLGNGNLFTEYLGFSNDLTSGD